MSKIVLILIIFLAFSVRIYGLNWDQNQHLHPDERFLTMVIERLRWPVSLNQYFQTRESPLNPHNIGYPFFVYGLWPLLLTKLVAAPLQLLNYNGITLTGRALSALFDIATVVLVFLLAQKVFASKKIALLSAFFYALAVLPIQLSHFLAVDTFLTFFLILSLYLLIKSSHPIFIGVSFALAVACKISALIFTPVIFLGFLFNRRHLLRSNIYFLISVFCVLRLSYPYLFTGWHLNPALLDNWRQLKQFDIPGAFPPGLQWIGTTPYLFPLANLLLWGLGLPLGIFSLLGLFKSTKSLFKPNLNKFIIILVIWVFLCFGYQGIQFAKPLRYFYPVYPVLVIFAAVFISCLRNRLFSVLCILLSVIWPLAFMSIYTRPHSRVTASAWIYQHIPPGSTISCEHWDDCLPLGGMFSYRGVELPLYNPDIPEKLPDLYAKLAQVDYLILSSNRLYGSIPSHPDRYPLTTEFYRRLFTGQAGFTKVAEFTSRPNLPLPFIHLCLTPSDVSYGYLSAPLQDCPLPGISFVDDYADESWTVYDHPKVIIFKKLNSGSQNPDTGNPSL